MGKFALAFGLLTCLAAVQAEAEEVCIRAKKGFVCAEPVEEHGVTFEPAGPDLVKVLRSRFPDLQRDDINVFSDGEVTFWTKMRHMACRLPKLTKCRVIHG